MEKETKKYLIIGTALVVSIGIGVVIWKKFQSSNSATAAAADQSNQDELALLSASLESNAYAGQAGATSYSPSVVGTSTPKSLADEVLALESALGFGPPTTPAPTGTPSTSAPPVPTTPVATGSPTPNPSTHPIDVAGHSPSMSEMIRYNHGSPLFEAEGVPGEEVRIS